MKVGEVTGSRIPRPAAKPLAKTVFPVPTLPVRNAVQGRPDSARGLKSVSSLAICSSLWTRLAGT